MATPVSNSIALTGNPFVDGLVQGSSWQFGGGPHTLTYSLSLNDTPVGGNWTQRSDMAVAVIQAAAAWSNVANISFVQSGSGGVFTASTADIAVGLTGDDLTNAFGAIGLGLFPDHGFAADFAAGVGYTAVEYPRPEGDVFFDNYSPAFNGVAAGQFGFEAILHELGHALGLKHLTDDGGNGRPTYAQLAISAYDNNQYSVMSSNDVGNIHDSTPMLFDIAAIQSIYGANMSYHTGNDTYGLLPYNNTLWDAGGNDTLDASSTFGARVDLRAGTFSFAINNPSLITAVAYGVTIENATGSNGNDTIIGNDAANTITGGPGADSLDGGPGNDTLNGGPGDDTFVVDSVSDSIVENAGEGTDTVQSYVPFSLPDFVENLTLLGSASYGVGNGSNNVIMGDAADNPLLRGNGAADTILGGDGNDWIDGDSGNNALPFGQTAGNDTIDGGPGDDTVLAGDGNDQVSGGDGTDVLVGEGGNDLMYGQGAIDYVDGRQGNDQLFGGDGNDILFGDGLTTTFGFGSDTIHGENGDDIIMGESGDHNAPGALDVLFGDDGKDLIYGGAGDDQIFGGNGNDIIDGGTGNDSITGGAGADILVGSGDSTNVGGPAATSGNDLFVYTAMADAGDTIYGFDSRVGDADGIDLRPLFDALGYTGTTARADGWLTVTTGASSADSVVWIDANGGGNSFTPLVTVTGVAPAVLTDAFFLIQ